MYRKYARVSNLFNTQGQGDAFYVYLWENKTRAKLLNGESAFYYHDCLKQLYFELLYTVALPRLREISLIIAQILKIYKMHKCLDK